MSVLFDTIKAIDDDYLIGLSNKGTVKRAYKDMEGMSTEPVMTDEEISCDFDGLKCKTIMPLSDSTCSCPQIGICRHIVTLVLLAKKKLEAEADDNGDSENGGSADSREDASRKSDDCTKEEVCGKNDCDRKTENRETSGSNNAEPEKTINLGELALKEAAEFPLEEILKKMTLKNLSSCIERIENNVLPKITKGQIITVEDVTDESVVKLIHPLSASGCSCHKQGLCPHKLKALLFVKYSEKMTELSEIKNYLSESSEQNFDLEQIEKTEKRIKNVLIELINTGLARLSPGMKDRLFELALTAHNAGMANAENYLRELGNLAEKYQSKSAEISNEQLTEKTVSIYLSENMKGEFRSEYSPVRDLYLVGLGARSFHSSAGYAGDSIYFIDKNTGAYYSFTNARADFYDGKSRRGGGDVPSPWNLGMSFKGLVGGCVKIYYGKVNKAHRLSSSTETRAEMAGSLGNVKEELQKYIYEDFSELWKDYFQADSDPEAEHEKLIMIRPDRLCDMKYDITTQKLQGVMVDGCGRKIRVSLQYKKEEATAIRSLEKLAEKLEIKGGKPPVFLGIVYISEEKVMFYPIETVDELNDAGTEIQKPDNACEAETGTDSNTDDMTDMIACMEQTLSFLKDCRLLLSDIFTSGLSVIPAYLSERLLNASENAGRQGLLKLSELLKELYGLLEQGRHGTEEKEEDTVLKADLFCRAAEYVKLGVDISGKELACERLNNDIEERRG